MAINALTFEEILQLITLAYKAGLGSDINLDPSGPIGQSLFLESNNSFVGNQSYLAALNACIINSAQNQDLDNLVGLLNVKRSLGVKTLIPDVVVTGDNATFIPSGSQASDPNGRIFESITDITIVGTDGVADFISLDPGDIVVTADTLTTILTPVIGWDTVNNPNAGITGSTADTDALLRSRFVRSAQPFAFGIPGAIKGNIMTIPDVNDVAVFENDKSILGLNDQPPHSYWVIIDYPDIRRNDQIAQTYYDRKGGSALDYSDLVIPAPFQVGNANTLSQGVRVMNWNKAERTRIEFEVDLAFDNNITTGNVESIKESIVSYLAETSVIGGTLSFSKLQAAVFCDAGQEFSVVSIRFDRDGGTPVSADLTALYYEIFFTTVDDITVSFV